MAVDDVELTSEEIQSLLNRERKRKEYQRQYRKDHPEKVKEAHERYRAKNPEKVEAWQKSYRERNKEKIKSYHREYRKKKAADEKAYDERLGVELKKKIDDMKEDFE